MQDCITVPDQLFGCRPHSSALDVWSSTEDNYSTVKPRVAVEARSTPSLCTSIVQGYISTQPNGQPDLRVYMYV